MQLKKDSKNSETREIFPALFDRKVYLDSYAQMILSNLSLTIMEKVMNVSGFGFVLS